MAPFGLLLSSATAHQYHIRSFINKNICPLVFPLSKAKANSFNEHLIKELDFETQSDYSFHVVITDGVAVDTTLVKIKVLNVNDWNPTFRYLEYEFFVTENSMTNGAKVGKIEVCCRKYF